MTKTRSFQLSSEQSEKLEFLSENLVGVNNFTKDARITKSLIMRRALVCYFNGLKTGKFEEENFMLKNE